MMKKIFFLLFLFYNASLMAQKTVAVTEVIDKEDKVPYMIESMVRTRLTMAIANKQGYSAFDRADLSTIMNEQNFQRTGLVDDKTIKELGKMTGAALVMIPEIAKNDDGQIYVSVKMLDVTTAKTILVDGQLMGDSSPEVESGCLELVTKILGDKQSSSNSMQIADTAVTLFGYLHIYPKDLGEFQSLPAQLLNAINKQGDYGFDSWRLPTEEELTIMRANSSSIPNFRNADYLCSDSPKRGIARLVTTEKSIKEKEAYLAQERQEELKSIAERQRRARLKSRMRKQAILNLLGVYSNYDDYQIGFNMHFEKVFNIRRCQIAKNDSPFDFDKNIAHPNKNFMVGGENDVRGNAWGSFPMDYYKERGLEGLPFYLSVKHTKDGEIYSVGDVSYKPIYYDFYWFYDRAGVTVTKDVCYTAMFSPRSSLVWYNSFTNDIVEFLVIYYAPVPAENLIKNKMRELGYIE